MTLKTLQAKALESFEANMLDGNKVNDCGGAMLSAESVADFLNAIIASTIK